MDAILFAGGYWIFLLIVLISMAHLRLQFRIADENISQPAIQAFLDQLRFPLTLVYDGPIGQFMDLENTSKALRVRANIMRLKSNPDSRRFLVIPVGLLVVFIGFPLAIFLDGAINSDHTVEQILYALGFLSPILALVSFRPWRFGQKMGDIQASLDSH